MQRRAVLTAVAVVLLATMALGQAQEQYLDVFTVQVKPEKRAEFDAIAKKIAMANRQNKGDTWVAMEQIYGHGNRVSFISFRNGFAGIETGMGAFYGAMQKGFGQAGADKIFQDFSECATSMHSELRRRRWDLSSNISSDPAAMAKLSGEARWLRTTAVHVKPGQVTAFESLLKDLKAAREKYNPPQTSLVSQAIAGQEGTVFYVTVLATSLADYDKTPTAAQLMGEDGYAKFLKASADLVESTESVINRFLPDASNAPTEIAAAAPDYWNPKPAPAGKKSAKAADSTEKK